MTKMLVCGGRDYADVPWIWLNLDRIDNERKVQCIIDGAQSKYDPSRGMIGTDYWAHQWALARARSVIGSRLIGILITNRLARDATNKWLTKASQILLLRFREARERPI